MFNERLFIAQVEAAGAEELAALLEHPTPEQERSLRAHLGDDRYQRMHGMALKRGITRSAAATRGNEKRPNVIVIHGIMGAELSVSSNGGGDVMWVNAFRIMRGWLDRLRLDAEGRREANEKFKVSASGIMKRYYGELILSLAQRSNVQAFWFDWRKDLDYAADALNLKINEWFGNNAPVHIVAHSMGGLAARTFIAKYPARWASMWDSEENGRRGGRFIMLGTPNYGSFTIPTVMTGLEGMVRKLALLDLRHSADELLETLNTFVGSYQMLPSPRVVPEAEPLYNAATYSQFKITVSQSHLDAARKFHDKIAGAVDTKRMIYVAGDNRPTLSGIRNWNKLNSLDGYDVTPDGDGRVPHRLGLLSGVETYYIDEDHGALSTNSTILRALDDLLPTGKTRALSQSPIARLTRSMKNLREEIQDNLDEELKQIDVSLSRMRVRSMSRVTLGGATVIDPAADETVPNERYGPEQRRLEESVTRGFLGRAEARQGDGTAGVELYEHYDKQIEKGSIEIGIVLGGIESINYANTRTSGGAPVDAIAVGHYLGVRPQDAELALDRSLSAALLGSKQSKDPNTISKSDLILTQYTERATIHGKLGEPFFIPDPRDGGGRDGTPGGRVIALAGMGEAGSFGAPELTVLARELCWSLGRLKKRHLATVLIGSGNGNLGIREAVAAWLNGVRRALTGSAYDEGRLLRRITFVELDPRRIRKLQNAILDEREQQEKMGLSIAFTELANDELNIIEQKKKEWDQKDWDNYKQRREHPREAEADAAPTRINLSLETAKKTYRFGAITETASIPERDIKLDTRVVMQANDELVGERRPAMQLERGRFLEGLLMPDDLRRQLYSRAPLVLMLDATTARIHWEMVAQPEVTTSAGATAIDDGASIEDTYTEGFLGTTRGLTRQLRTTFAPPPEPPPPPRRVLRVLVVADPAADAHLPGAQEEGVEVADLFESYNLAHQDIDEKERSSVQVTRMFGPLEATRTNVLRELMSRPYDVLHYAGHCVFQWDGDPDASGWIFNAQDKELLSAYELNRIDRVPKFVFSNACESGITPDRSEERSAGLAPSFAEAFFNRGVSNFVCTAWPVDDLGAREFALMLYSRLLGLRKVADRPGRYERDDDGPRPMHLALRDARREVAVTPNGRTTWGAYQHYGSPYFQLFYPSKKEDDDKPIASTSSSSAGKAVASPGKKSRRSGKKAKNSKVTGHR